MKLPGGLRLGYLLTVVFVWMSAQSVQAGSLDQTLELIMQRNRKAAKSQKKIDKLSDNTADLLTQYRTVLQQIESVKAYNAQVKTLLEAQGGEVAELERQIEDATSVSREIKPLMARMLEALGEFIKLDVPFLMEEREKRLADLNEMMGKANVTDSEKFRRILEAYEIENDFARNIDAYKGTLVIGNTERVVDFLRVGRVCLVYLTQDGKEAGVWDQKKRQWEQLPDEYRSSIKEGLRIAQKQAAPDLMRLPIFAPEVAQ